MRIRTFGIAALLLSQIAGCRLFGDVVLPEVPSAPKQVKTKPAQTSSGQNKPETKSESQPTAQPESQQDAYPESYSDWSYLEASRKNYQETYPKIVDGKSFKEHVGSRSDASWRAKEFLKRHCQDPATKNPRCAAARPLVGDMPRELVELIDQAMAIPEVDFDFIEPYVMSLERDKAVDAAKVDAWYESLATRKIAYWTNRLEGVGGKPSVFVQGGSDDDSLCLFYGAPPKDSTNGLAYAIKGASKLWLQCAFPTPPAQIKRDDKDYWELEVDFLDRYTQNLGLMFPVASPSRTSLWSVAVPTDTIIQRIKAAAARIDREITGNWASVKVKYVTREKTGKEWRNNQWVDSWDVDVLGRASFYFRWR